MLKRSRVVFSFLFALLICFGVYSDAQAQPQKQKPTVPNSAISRPSSPSNTKADPSNATRGVAPTGILPQTYLRKPVTPQSAQNRGSAIASAFGGGGSSRYSSSSFPDIMRDMNNILTTLPPLKPFDHSGGNTDYSGLTPPTGQNPRLVDLRR